MEPTLEPACGRAAYQGLSPLPLGEGAGESERQYAAGAFN